MAVILEPVAMILAAGRGERMRPLTDHTPKALLSVGGKPLIFWHLEKLAAAGFRKVVINHAHLGAQIEALVGNGSRWQLNVKYSPESEALETAGGIRHALPLLEQDVFAVVNADVHSDYAYDGLLHAMARLRAGKFRAHLIMVDNPAHHLQGDFGIENGLAIRTAKRMFTFGGLSAYRADVFSPLIPGRKSALAPLLYEQIARGAVAAEYFPGHWCDVGTPQRLAELDAQMTGRASL